MNYQHRVKTHNKVLRSSLALLVLALSVYLPAKAKAVEGCTKGDGQNLWTMPFKDGEYFCNQDSSPVNGDKAQFTITSLSAGCKATIDVYSVKSDSNPKTGSTDFSITVENKQSEAIEPFRAMVDDQKRPDNGKYMYVKVKFKNSSCEDSTLTITRFHHYSYLPVVVNQVSSIRNHTKKTAKKKKVSNKKVSRVTSNAKRFKRVSKKSTTKGVRNINKRRYSLYSRYSRNNKRPVVYRRRKLRPRFMRGLIINLRKIRRLSRFGRI